MKHAIFMDLFLMDFDLSVLKYGCNHKCPSSRTPDHRRGVPISLITSKTCLPLVANRGAQNGEQRERKEEVGLWGSGKK